MLPSDVRKIIEDEDDFGHEMRVGNIINNIPHSTTYQSRIHSVTHGQTYNDPITDKPRQYDYRVEIRLKDASKFHSAECRLMLAVECKNLQESSPLIVCGRNRTSDEAFHCYVQSRDDAINNPNHPAEIKTVKLTGLYSFKEFVGKSLLHFKKSGSKDMKSIESEIYERWSQAIASCKDLAESSYSIQRSSKCRNFCSFIMPVVVFPNNRLWIAKYDDQGKLESDPEMVNACEYFVGTKYKLGTMRADTLLLTHIHFVTLDGLADLLASFTIRPEGKWERLFGEFC